MARAQNRHLLIPLPSEFDGGKKDVAICRPLQLLPAEKQGGAIGANCSKELQNKVFFLQADGTTFYGCSQNYLNSRTSNFEIRCK